jgi:predicted amidophosphoribosyltransferase
MTAPTQQLTRPEKVALAQRLAQNGLSQRQIGVQMGVTQQCVHQWLQETPICPVCGDPMVKPAERCGFCIAEDRR